MLATADHLSEKELLALLEQAGKAVEVGAIYAHLRLRRLFWVILAAFRFKRIRKSTEAEFVDSL